MVIRIFDVETTGFAVPEHRVVEIAAYDLSPDERVELVGSFLVNPGREIPAEASAVHHLIDADVAAAQPFERVWPAFLEGTPAIYAAHNCAFEQQFIPTP